jgi:hypothetical protein
MCAYRARRRFPLAAAPECLDPASVSVCLVGKPPAEGAAAGAASYDAQADWGRNDHVPLARHHRPDRPGQVG